MIRPRAIRLEQARERQSSACVTKVPSHLLHIIDVSCITELAVRGLDLDVAFQVPLLRFCLLRAAHSSPVNFGGGYKGYSGEHGCGGEQDTHWQQQQQAVRPLRMEGTQAAGSKSKERSGADDRAAKKRVEEERQRKAAMRDEGLLLPGVAAVPAMADAHVVPPKREQTQARSRLICINGTCRSLPCVAGEIAVASGKGREQQSHWRSVV
ncbi:MAG: hypothetical protein FRX49_06306 [Trebouxia sp. A1-2]|nr:MAG: hypothetical protein FRX49_06306 [Trebouxia sp. A1-2]